MTSKIIVKAFGDSDNDQVFTKADSIGAGKKVILQDVNGKKLVVMTTDSTGHCTFNVATGTYIITRNFPKGFELANPSPPGSKGITVVVGTAETKEVHIGSKTIGSKTIGSKTIGSTTVESISKPLLAISQIVKGVVGPSVPNDRIIYSQAGQVTYASYLIDQLRVKTLRAWQTCDGRPRGVKPKNFDSLRVWAADGVYPTFVLATQDWNRGLPTAETSKATATEIVDAIAGLKCSVEIGNEPNIGGYWPGKDPKKFVDTYANPMYEIFHAAGIEVIGAGVSWDVNYVGSLIDAGLKCDRYGFHPYRKTAAELDNQLRQLSKIVGDKKVDLTEFNTFLGPNYRLMAKPNDALGRSPAMSATTVTEIQKASWDVLKTYPMIGRVHYFIDYSKAWKHTTGPLCLLEEVYGKDTKVIRYKPTAFANDFYSQV